MQLILTKFTNQSTSKSYATGPRHSSLSVGSYPAMFLKRRLAPTNSKYARPIKLISLSSLISEPRTYALSVDTLARSLASSLFGRNLKRLLQRRENRNVRRPIRKLGHQKLWSRMGPRLPFFVSVTLFPYLFHHSAMQLIYNQT